MVVLHEPKRPPTVQEHGAKSDERKTNEQKKHPILKPRGGNKNTCPIEDIQFGYFTDVAKKARPRESILNSSQIQGRGTWENDQNDLHNV